MKASEMMIILSAVMAAPHMNKTLAAVCGVIYALFAFGYAWLERRAERK